MEGIFRAELLVLSKYIWAKENGNNTCVLGNNKYFINKNRNLIFLYLINQS